MTREAFSIWIKLLYIPIIQLLDSLFTLLIMWTVSIAVFILMLITIPIKYNPDNKTHRDLMDFITSLGYITVP